MWEGGGLGKGKSKEYKQDFLDEPGTCDRDRGCSDQKEYAREKQHAPAPFRQPPQPLSTFAS